jgi:transposase
MLQPTVRRTWATRGDTPIHRSWDRHDRLSVLAALTVAPRRRRIGLYFTILDHNVRTDDVTTFLRGLRQSLRRPLTVVLDRLNAHRSAETELRRRLGAKVQFEFLPGYAPQLNPVEQVWCHTKRGDLANYIPVDINALGQAVLSSLSRKRTQPQLLSNFFDHAGIPLRP